MDAIGKKTRTRVCFVSLGAYPLFNPAVEKVFGGAEVDLYLLATELAKDERFEVSFVVGDYGQPRIEARQGVTLYKSVKTDRGMILEGWKVWRALRQANADIYMHEACSLGTTLIAAFCRIHGRRFVYRTAHTDETDGTYFRRNPVRGLFVKWAFKRAHFLLTQNDQDAENLLRTLHVNSLVIKNAIRPSQTDSGAKTSVLWVARSVAFKRPELFLKLARQCPDIAFTMICQRGTDDKRYGELVKEAQTIGNLTFIERVPFGEVGKYFEAARVFVNTSDSEGFPNTFVQAANAGAAILSLNVNPDDFLSRHRCGFCAGGDWKVLVETLKMWLADGQAEQFGQNGREYIKSHHDLARIIERYKEIFLTQRL
ncbi:MAG: glycosyltransferase family 4 protein [Planctomycetaceae bacterium]|nr:glycosyltransferase family 4 protein [Planctomycetaceae bacterium]